MLDFSLMPYKKDIVAALSDFIKIPSVKSDPVGNMPYGKPVFDALMYILNLAEDLDLESVNLFSHAGYVEYGEGDDLFVILTHIDVVPAGEGWTYPPFGGVTDEGRIYGRGAVDDKGAAICALYVLHALKENCKTLNKRVRLVFGCDEESGWADMDFYLEKENKTPLMAISPDADFPIINAEKGLVHINIENSSVPAEGAGVRIKYLRGGTRVNVVPNHAECLLEGEPDLLEEALSLFLEDTDYKLEYEKVADGIKIYAEGVASHGSKPQYGENAVMRIAAFLNTLPMKKSAASSVVYTLAEKIGFDCFGEKLGLKCENDMGVLTVNVGIADITEEKANVSIDIRYPSCTTKEQVLSVISETFAPCDISVGHNLVPHYVSPDSDLVKGLSAAYEEVTGEKAYCISIGGATYARVFDNSVAFGPVFPGQESREHRNDEYIDIDSLIKAGDIMAAAILNLCT